MRNIETANNGTVIAKFKCGYIGDFAFRSPSIRKILHYYRPFAPRTKLHMKNLLNQITILLIENDSDWLIDVYAALQEAGFDVLIATGGNEGFCLARRVRPDLIICETALADISGVELCRMVRADKYLSSTLFILMGEPQNQNGDIAAEGFDAGADDYFEVDCHPHFVAAKVARLIELQRSETAIRLDYQTLHRSEQHLVKLIDDTSKLIASLDTTDDYSASDESFAQKSKTFFQLGDELKIQTAEKPLHLLKKNNDALMAWKRSLQVRKSDDAGEFQKVRRGKTYYEIAS